MALELMVPDTINKMAGTEQGGVYRAVGGGDVAGVSVGEELRV